MPHTEKCSFTRKELYEMAWSKPMTMLGRELSLPPLTLSEVLRHMGIPLPPSGHWQKVAAGKPFERPLLPEVESEVAREFEVVRLGEGERWEDIPIPSARELETYEVFERQPENAIVVPDTLEEPHKLVRETLRVLRKGQVDRDYGWVAPPPGTAQALLDVEVSQERLEFALRVMDALLRALERRGLKVKLREKGGRREGTYVVVDGEEVAFGIYERLERVKVPQEHPWDPSSKWQPTGKLALRIYCGNNLTEDSKRKRLEERLNEFVAKLHQAAAKHKQNRVEAAERERYWAEQRVREHQRQQEELAERERQRKAAAELQQLEETVSRWRRANDIREFVAAVIAEHNEGGGIAEDSELERHLNWALDAADILDPDP